MSLMRVADCTLTDRLSIKLLETKAIRMKLQNPVADSATLQTQLVEMWLERCLAKAKSVDSLQNLFVTRVKILIWFWGGP